MHGDEFHSLDLRRIGAGPTSAGCTFCRSETLPVDTLMAKPLTTGDGFDSLVEMRGRWLAASLLATVSLRLDTMQVLIWTFMKKFVSFAIFLNKSIKS